MTCRCQRRRVVAAVLAGALAAWAPAQSLLRHLPDACPVAIETGAGDALVRGLQAALLPLPDGVPEDVRAQLAAALLAARAFLGADFTELARQLAGGGAALGLMPGGPRGRPLPLLVLRPDDMAAATAFLARFGERVHRVAHDELLLLSASADGLRLLQAQAAAPSGRWAARAADAAAPPPGALRATADLDALRALLPALRGIDAKTAHGAARVFSAPLLHAVARATRLDATLRADALGLQLRARLDASAADSRWRELEPADGGDHAAPAPPPDALLLLALDRSLLRVLQEPDRYLDESGALAVQSFLSVADQVDGSATSFAADVLGSLREPATLYAVPTPADVLDAPPPLRLPGVALCAELAPGRDEQDLGRTLTAFSILVNQQRAQRQQAPFRVRSVRDGAVRGLCAEPPPWRGPGLPPTEQGLSPTVLYGHGHVVLASTEVAARAVMEQVAAGARVTLRGSALRLRGPAIAAALLQNRGPIELARRLDEGDTAEQAARFVATLAGVLQGIAALDVALGGDDAATTLDLDLRRSAP
ncbi:MAG: hypothetical protein AB7O97_15345 [Planctomycetota bacterium]